MGAETIELDPETKLAALLAKQAEDEAAQALAMEDPAYRWMIVSTGSEAFLLPVAPEDQDDIITNHQAGERINIETSEKRRFYFAPGVIKYISQLTYAHKFLDDEQRAKQQQQQMLQAFAAAAQRGQAPPQRAPGQR